jgi:hypothetical protein
VEIKQTFTYCDNCNLSRLLGVPGESREDWPAVFAGTRKQALKNGWVEADYGDACPRCAKRDAEAELEEGGAGLEGLLLVLHCGARSPGNPDGDEEDQPITCSMPKNHNGLHTGGCRGGTLQWVDEKRWRLE